MQYIPPEIVNHELNHTTQAVLICASWGLTAIFFVIAVRMGIRERTPFYPLMIVAAMLGAFAEPLYDVATALYFYSTEGMVTHFESFGTPQPIWTHSGYAVLYASAAIVIAHRLYHGIMTRQALYKLAGAGFVMSCIFEMYGINGNAYSYYGPHVLRILNYPFAIAILETAQIILFAVAATILRKRVSNAYQLVGLLALFPVTFYGTNFGAGWPMIISLHLPNPQPGVVAVATVLSICLALVLIRGACSFVPKTLAAEASEPAEQRIPAVAS
ncbi:hypothetical protein [Mycolicibacter senuensis]|uniref:hypothetical protein n=1 Tax=Mycolicibacter senuensis TaxID=386913 RepID=UPI000DCB7950|nr:hypothetical protein [Mycolicibacter senuensis]RAV01572.1 hypothetical protein DQP56_07120 [Mycolicibacter senuensis]